MLKAWCNYRFSHLEEDWNPEHTEPVTILSYDGDKRFLVRFDDGAEIEMKGYWLRRDREGNKYIRRIHKHLLQGKKRETFDVVQRKTRFQVWCPSSPSTEGLEFDTRKRAIKAAVQIARELDCEIEINIDRTQTNNSSYTGGPLHRFGLYVSPDGFVWTYKWRPGMEEGFIKYVRGYGKINPKTPQQRRRIKFLKDIHV